jgi:hypothetical protein
MSNERPLPLDRVYLLNPGQSLDVGDRTLTGLRPPLFDNPATVGLYDDRSRTLFSSDCFGAPLPSAELADGSDLGDVPPDDLRAASCCGRCSPPHPKPTRSSDPTRLRWSSDWPALNQSPLQAHSRDPLRPVRRGCLRDRTDTARLL